MLYGLWSTDTFYSQNLNFYTCLYLTASLRVAKLKLHQHIFYKKIEWRSYHKVKRRNDCIAEDTFSSFSAYQECDRQTDTLAYIVLSSGVVRQKLNTTAKVKFVKQLILPGGSGRSYLLGCRRRVDSPIRILQCCHVIFTGLCCSTADVRTSNTVHTRHLANHVVIYHIW